MNDDGPIGIKEKHITEKTRSVDAELEKIIAGRREAIKVVGVGG